MLTTASISFSEFTGVDMSYNFVTLITCTEWPWLARICSRPSSGWVQSLKRCLSFVATTLSTSSNEYEWNCGWARRSSTNRKPSICEESCYDYGQISPVDVTALWATSCLFEALIQFGSIFTNNPKNSKRMLKSSILKLIKIKINLRSASAIKIMTTSLNGICP